MKNIVIIMAAALATAFAIPASAQTYIGISGGATKPTVSKNKGTFSTTVPATTVAPVYPSIPADTSLAWRTKFDKGFNVSGHIGRRFGGVRAEAEFNYTRSGVKRHAGVTAGGTNIDTVDASVLTRGPALGATIGAIVNSGIGSQKSYGAMVNGFYDINSAGNFQPYVGAGVGVQRTRFDYRPSNVDVGQGKGTKFAWQAMAGATYKVSPSFEVFGQYTYRDAGKVTMNLDLVPAKLKATSRQSILSAGIRIPFGAAQ